MSYFELYEKRKKAKFMVIPGTKWIGNCSPFMVGEELIIQKVNSSEVGYRYNDDYCAGMFYKKPIDVFLECCTFISEQ